MQHSQVSMSTVYWIRVKNPLYFWGYLSSVDSTENLFVGGLRATGRAEVTLSAREVRGLFQRVGCLWFLDCWIPLQASREVWFYFFGFGVESLIWIWKPAN